MSIGGHHSANAGTTTWLTPPGILDALGGWQSFEYYMLCLVGLWDDCYTDASGGTFRNAT